MRNRVMTDPKELVRIELKNAGFDMDTMQVPKRVYLLADGIYDAMIEESGWHIGWDGTKIDSVISQIVDLIADESVL